jgi:hypothetical protein
LGLDRDTVELLVGRNRQLHRFGPDVALGSHAPVLEAHQERAWQDARRALGAGLAVPGQDELGLEPDLLHLKLRLGELVRVSDEYVLLPEQVESIESHLMRLGDGFTVAEFRDVTGLSRKHSIPYLEWADGRGLTFRRGDSRFRASSSDD